MVPRFALQLDVRAIPAYAARFPSRGEGRVLAAGRAAYRRGYYQLGEFIELCRWKTPRSAPLVVQNGAGHVRSASTIALARGSSERERIHALLELRGVGWPTASVLLHLACPDRWPILDVRALHALGVTGRVTYGYGFWEEYVETFRELVKQAGVDGRTIDRGLWQWSREQGGWTVPRSG